MPWDCDYLVVGAGFSGLVMAERLANVLGKKVLVVDKRSHVGGNCYDEYDAAGILTHRYGPHYFRTNSTEIVDYLSKFTGWHPVNYSIKSFSNGRYWSFPINLNTFEEFIGKKSSSKAFEDWLEKNRVHIDSPQNSEEIIISKVGTELYRLFYEGYTKKQWDKHPSELDPSVCARIPIRTNRDDRYLRENFQALPQLGYSRLFENMLRSTSDRVQVILNTDYREVLSGIRFKHMIYTGAIDEYFNYEFGDLPYRSLRFESESFDAKQLKCRFKVSGKKGYWQPAVQVNYPNQEAFTRIVEIKHATGQQSENSSIVKEYPEHFSRGGEPFYPVPTKDANALYKKYEKRAESEKNITFIGRLARYKYYNMDQVVGFALKAFKKISKET